MENNDKSYKKFLDYCQTGGNTFIGLRSMHTEICYIVGEPIYMNINGNIAENKLEKLQNMYNRIKTQICSWSNDCAEIHVNRLNDVFAHFARLNGARIIRACDARASHKFALTTQILSGDGGRYVIGVIVCFYMQI